MGGGEALRSRDEVHRSTGNYGFQDQREAMRWVQDSIKEFGGDPKRVLLAGESSGGMAVSCHMGAKRSKGLFSRVVIESGSFSSLSVRPRSWAQKVYNDTLAFT